jgi:hypothetical protein
MIPSRIPFNTLDFSLIRVRIQDLMISFSQWEERIMKTVFSVLIVSILLGYLFPEFVIAQKNPNIGYLKEMPYPPSILSDIKGPDEFDVAARQCAALGIFQDVLNANVMARHGSMTQMERHFNILYKNAEGQLLRRIYAKLDPNGTGQSEVNSPRNKWNQIREGYQVDVNFITPLLNRYLSPQLCDQYLRPRVDAMNKEHESLTKTMALNIRDRPVEIKANETAPKTTAITKRDEPISVGGNWKLIVSIVAGCVLLLVVIRILKKVLPEPKETPPDLINRRLVAGGTKYNLYWVTGKVVGQSKLATTHVSGGGGGSSGAPVTVSSSTTIHNDIFLLDSAGKEHSFQLSDFNIACREGHELTVIWAIRETKKTGSYIIVVNQTTSQAYFDTKELSGMYMDWHPFLLLVLFAVIFSIVQFSKWFGNLDIWVIVISLFAWIMCLFVVLPILGQFGKQKAKRFKSNFKLEDLKNNAA